MGKVSNLQSKLKTLQGQYDEAVTDGKDVMDEVSANIMSHFQLLAPSLDWSQVNAFKYFDEKSGQIRNVGSNDEDKDEEGTLADATT